MGTSKGNGKYIETPEKLYKLFEDYKTYNKNNPTITNHYNVKTDSQGTLKHLPPLTMQGFSTYLHKQKIISNLNDYTDNKSNNYSDYSEIIRTIKNEIFSHNLKGASVGAYQHNIIARQLGLVDKQEVKEVKDAATKEEIQKELDRLIKDAKDSI